MDVAEKLWKGNVWHYQDILQPIANIAEYLVEDIDSGRINDPDLEQRLVEDIVNDRSEINAKGFRTKSAKKIHKLTGCTGLLSYLRFYLGLEGKLSYFKRKPHPLIENYLNDIEMPIHLKRGLTIIRANVDTINKLYGLQEYWDSIPRDNDTEPYYAAANIFREKIHLPFQKIEKELYQNGFSDEYTRNICDNLKQINNACYEIRDIGKSIIHLMGNYTMRESNWDLTKIDPDCMP